MKYFKVLHDVNLVNALITVGVPMLGTTDDGYVFEDTKELQLYIGKYLANK